MIAIMSGILFVFLGMLVATVLWSLIERVTRPDDEVIEVEDKPDVKALNFYDPPIPTPLEGRYIVYSHGIDGEYHKVFETDNYLDIVWYVELEKSPVDIWDSELAVWVTSFL